MTTPDPAISHGWQCPRCQTIWAPHVQSCTTCPPSQVYPWVPHNPTIFPYPDLPYVPMDPPYYPPPNDTTGAPEIT